MTAPMLPGRGTFQRGSYRFITPMRLQHSAAAGARHETHGLSLRRYYPVLRQHRLSSLKQYQDTEVAKWCKSDCAIHALTTVELGK